MSDIKIILIVVAVYCLLVWLEYIVSLSPFYDRLTTRRRSRAADELHERAHQE
jgi:hypothetical protein